MSGAYEFRLPDLGEGLTEGEVARWLVVEGQHVDEDEPLVEIQTDKTTVEIPAPAAGLVTSILVPEGKVVPVGTVLVVIGGDRGETATDDESAPAGAERVRATPRVRSIARAHGVDVESLRGTGRDGRVTEEDVLEATASAAAPAAPAAAAQDERRVPLRGIRRAIAEHLAQAHREIPAVTFVEECDFTELSRRRGAQTYVPFVLRAVARCLKEFPELNARLEGDEIVYLERYDLGLAVQTDEGLVVPVVRDCDTSSIEELGLRARRLADAARAGRLRPEELRGATFTVTSAGRVSGLFVTPLVNHPQVAILGVHRIAPRPVVRDGGIHVREMGNVSVTFDHRVVDGARAGDFALSVIRRLEAAEGAEA